jgi:hypothetical protein
MAGMCNTHVRNRKCIQYVSQKNTKRKNYVGILDQRFSTFYLFFTHDPLPSFIHFCVPLILFNYNKCNIYNQDVFYQNGYQYESVSIHLKLGHGNKQFWHFEFLKFMNALFLGFLKMWKIFEVNIHKHYFGSHST